MTYGLIIRLTTRNGRSDSNLDLTYLHLHPADPHVRCKLDAGLSEVAVSRRKTETFSRSAAVVGSRRCDGG